MKLAHTSNDGLAGFFIGVSFERWIFFSKLLKRDGHFFLRRFGFWFDSNRDNRLWEFHLLEDDRICLVAESIPCASILQPNSCCDITSVNAIHFFTLISVHKQDAADALALAFRRVVNIATRFQYTRVYAEIAQFSNIRVSHDLERQRRHRFFICGFALSGFPVFSWKDTCNSRNVQWRWHVQGDRI